MVQSTIKFVPKFQFYLKNVIFLFRWIFHLSAQNSEISFFRLIFRNVVYQLKISKFRFSSARFRFSARKFEISSFCFSLKISIFCSTFRNKTLFHFFAENFVFLVKISVFSSKFRFSAHNFEIVSFFSPKFQNNSFHSAQNVEISFFNSNFSFPLKTSIFFFSSIFHFSAENFEISMFLFCSKFRNFDIHFSAQILETTKRNCMI
jgi:hypothetical protein